MSVDYDLLDTRDHPSDDCSDSNMSWTDIRLERASRRIFEALKQLRDNFGVETLLIITRGNVKNSRFTKAHASPKTASFLRNVVHTDAGQLGEKLEGYVVSGAADTGGLIGNTQTLKQKDKIKAARDCILNSLVNLLRDQNVSEDRIPRSMNYKSYKTKIRNQFGVELVGYPGEKGVINPGELDVAHLKELLARLNDGRCHWRMRNESADLNHINDCVVPMDDVMADDTAHTPSSSSDTSTRVGEVDSIASFLEPSVSHTDSPDAYKASSSPTSDWHQGLQQNDVPSLVCRPSDISLPHFPTNTAGFHNSDSYTSPPQMTNLVELTKSLQVVLGNFEACFKALNNIPPHAHSSTMLPNPISFLQNPFHLDSSMSAPYAHTVPPPLSGTPSIFHTPAPMDCPDDPSSNMLHDMLFTDMREETLDHILGHEI